MMRILWVYLTLIVLVVSCGKSDQNTIVNGNVVGLKDGEYVYLKKAASVASFQLETTDSALVKNGNFTFKFDSKDLNLNFLQFADNERVVPFIAEEGIINIRCNIQNPNLNTIGGTYNNDKYQEYSNKANEYIDKIKNFEIENNSKLITAQKENNSKLLNVINLENNKLKEEYRNFNKQFIESNKTAYVSLILLEQLTKKGDYTLEEGKEIYNAFSADIVNTVLGKQIGDFFNPEFAVADLSIGARFPDLVAKSTDDIDVSIYTKLGKITIIDVWASWCAPCRMENPNLVKLYEDYKGKGLEIIGISLDKNKDSWLKAIKRDNLTWTQISNLKQWEDPIVKKLALEGIPATFIIDENGKLLAKDLRAAELRKFIEQNL